MRPVIDEQTDDLLMEDWICDQLVEPVDISSYLEEMGKTPIWANVDADHLSYW